MVDALTYAADNTLMTDRARNKGIPQSESLARLMIIILYGTAEILLSP